MSNLNPINSLQHVFRVSELLHFDMIYIYHHISEGAKVKLVKNELNLEGNYSYLVYFKNFKLGSIVASKLFTALYGNPEIFEGNVASVTKEKYMPIKDLDIVIKQQDLRLVS